MNRDVQTIIQYLRDLSFNNERTWFMAHKDQYLEAKALFENIAEQLMIGIADFDSSCAGLTLKDCTYRIYRDVRFSKDKSPYKTHFGVYVCPGGKKSGYAGYYFHIGTGLGTTYPRHHILAVGDYRYNPAALKILREDILYGEGDFHEIVTQKVSQKFKLDDEEKLCRVPSGFPADTPYAEYLKLKTFCLCHYPDETFITNDNVIENTLKLFKTTLPFTQYVNRAIQYSREEL